MGAYLIPQAMAYGSLAMKMYMTIEEVAQSLM